MNQVAFNGHVITAVKLLTMYYRDHFTVAKVLMLLLEGEREKERRTSYRRERNGGILLYFSRSLVCFSAFLIECFYDSECPVRRCYTGQSIFCTFLTVVRVLKEKYKVFRQSVFAHVGIR